MCAYSSATAAYPIIAGEGGEVGKSHPITADEVGEGASLTRS